MIHILHNKPTIGDDEIEAIKNVFASGWIAQGKETEKFENEFCEYLEFEPGYSIAVSSGSAALYMALIAIGVKKGNEIIIPSYVCSAVLNAVYLAGANPVLVDINSEDFNLSFEKTSQKITPYTKAIIIPHTYGMPTDIDKFLTLGIPIIEDCAQALGSKYNNKKVGTFGVASIFSFYASKCITTGNGGMIFSKDKQIIEKIKDYREFDNRKEYRPRFNFQMSDIQAAMGRAQLKKISLFLQRRKEIANEYQEFLPQKNIWPKYIKNKEPNYYRLLLRLSNPQKLKIFLEKKGIKTIVPIKNYELLHNYLNIEKNKFENSEKISKTTLSLPIYPLLKEENVRYICEEIKKSDIL